MRAISALSFCLGLLPSVAVAQAPALLPVQGVLSDADGMPLEGPTNVTFTLYDAATAGTMLHQELQQVTVENGLFTVYLGSGATALDLALFRSPNVWLGITVEADPEMAPRFRIGTAPYAALAQFCEDANMLAGLPATDYAPAAHAHDFSTLTNIPAGLADGDDEGFNTEAQLTALLNDNYAPAAHAHAWGSITGVPAGFADNVDNDTTYSAGAGLALNANEQFSVTGVTSAMITDLTIATADLANGAVTSVKIADGTIDGTDINPATTITASDFRYRNPLARALYVDPTTCQRGVSGVAPFDRTNVLHPPANALGPGIRIDSNSGINTYSFYCPFQFPEHGAVEITGAQFAWSEAADGTNCLVGADIRWKNWASSSFGNILSTVYDGANATDFAFNSGGNKAFPPFTHTVVPGQIFFVRPFITSNAATFGDCRFLGVRIDYTVDRP